MSPHPPNPETQRAKAQVMIWWTLWASMLSGLTMVYLVLGRAPFPALPPEKALTGLVGLAPLFISIVIRWLVLPKVHDLRRALPVFVVGLALAEACGLLGIFLGGPYREDLFILGLLGLVQFAPFFARHLAEPRPGSFFRNG